MSDVELINELLTMAGTIMEDASTDAILLDAGPLAVRIERTATAGREITALADAAKVLIRRR